MPEDTTDTNTHDEIAAILAESDKLIVGSDTIPEGITIQPISYQTIDGFDDCIVGVVDNFNGVSRLCYDKIKMMKKLVASGATTQNASETVNSYVFPEEDSFTAPCFLDRCADVGIVGYDNYPPLEEIVELTGGNGG